MTKFDRNIRLHRAKSISLLLGAGMVVSALGGCGGVSLSSIGSFGGGGSKEQSTSQRQIQPAQNSVSLQAVPISFAPVFGPPSQVASKLSGALKTEAQARSIKVVNTGGSSQYTVRGYLSASPDKNGTKLAYIWDISNKAGKRAHRIKGEEIVPGRNTSNPWASVNQGAIQAIAAKTTTRLANWLPKSNGSSSGLVRQASLQNSGRGQTTRSFSNAQVVAVIPAVRGAPGDGSNALANALRRQLTGKGIKIASVGRVSNPYQVIGIVNLTSAGSNKQNIKIEWVVRDPRNKKLGTVTQKNTIPAGSLDGAWGGTADAAASAAAQGIAKLLKN